jgi:hypothetical protein
MEKQGGYDDHHGNIVSAGKSTLIGRFFFVFIIVVVIDNGNGAVGCIVVIALGYYVPLHKTHHPNVSFGPPEKLDVSSGRSLLLYVVRNLP